MLLSSAVSALSAVVDAAEKEEFDPNTVTPGVIGFAVTFLVAVAVLLLILDMTRRIRRTNYRAQVQEQLDAEEQAEAEGAGDSETDGAAGAGAADTAAEPVQESEPPAPKRD
ncbi:hypothetical protein M3147_02445 [Agromyces mediolanus]|uniref:hypothetical protein n=1 Tax=Agromyces mediolanus TaxID=41986 RepID=UPI00203D8786|nr:hypothetical protein [Agromyces mediolanus]MCM3656103.1 hypothetical protein [Agromyces mediolanus]